MTQTLLAKQAHVSQQFVSKLLKGERRPKWRTAKRLALLTQTSPQFWMEGDTREIVAAFNEWSKEQNEI